jgi:hypothetical protein
MNAEDMLKQLRMEMERLAETTPSPPPHILEAFTKQFKDYKDVSKPAETNGLAKINVFRSALEKSATTPSLMTVRTPEVRSAENIGVVVNG